MMRHEYDQGLYVQGQIEKLFPQQNFHILWHTFMSLGTNIHHNKTMCILYDPGLYVQG